MAFLPALAASAAPAAASAAAPAAASMAGPAAAGMGSAAAGMGSSAPMMAAGGSAGTGSSMMPAMGGQMGTTAMGNSIFSSPFSSTGSSDNQVLQDLINKAKKEGPNALQKGIQSEMDMYNQKSPLEGYTPPTPVPLRSQEPMQLGGLMSALNQKSQARQLPQYGNGSMSNMDLNTLMALYSRNS